METEERLGLSLEEFLHLIVRDKSCIKEKVVVWDAEENQESPQEGYTMDPKGNQHFRVRRSTV